MANNNQALAPTVGGLPIVFNQPIDPSLMTPNFQSGVQDSLLPKLSIQGSRWTVIMDSDRKIQLPTLTFDVVMIAARDQNSRAFFIGNFAPGDSKAPDCSSTNGFNVDAGVAAQQAPNCAVCPNAAFGTAITQQGTRGKGQACGQFRQVVIVPYDVLQLIVQGHTKPEDAVVCTLRIPASSLKDYGKYVGFLAKQGGNPTICVTRLGFAEGVGHPQPVFQAVQALTPQEQQAVLALRQRDDVEQAALTPPRTAPEAAPATWTAQAANPNPNVSFVPTPQAPQISLADAIRQTAPPQTAAPVPPPPQPTVWPTAAPQAPTMASWPTTPVEQPQQPAPQPVQPVQTAPPTGLPWTAQIQQPASTQPVAPPPTSAPVPPPPQAAPPSAENAADDILSRWTTMLK